MGQKLDIEEAAEPTDIIWENRRFSRWDRAVRSMIVVFCVAILLCISFVFIFLCSKASATPLLRYPSSANCTEIKDIYGENLLKYAILEAHTNQPLIDEGKDTAFMGFT